MAKYALVVAGKIKEVREAERGSPPHKLAEDGGPLLRPIVDAGPPAYDFATQELKKSEVIEKDKVRVEYTIVPIDLNAKKLRRIAAVNAARARILLKPVTEKEYDDFVASQPIEWL